jgi:hypothetical protein
VPEEGFAGTDGWGTGGEVLLRLTPGRFSIALGLQATKHPETSDGDLTAIGPFLEPRILLSEIGESAALYVSAHAGLIDFRFEDDAFNAGSASWYLNGGGGLLINLGERANLDIGGTAGTDDSGNADVTARVGLSIGLGG